MSRPVAGPEPYALRADIWDRRNFAAQRPFIVALRAVTPRRPPVPRGCGCRRGAGDPSPLNTPNRLQVTGMLARLGRMKAVEPCMLDHGIVAHVPPFQGPPQVS